MRHHQIDVFKLTPEATIPTRAIMTDAGLDLFAAESIFIPKGESKLIQTQIAIRIPVGYVGKLAGRSSMNKKGIITAEGVIDCGYSGSIGVILNNFSCDINSDPVLHRKGYQINAGDRIAQLIIYNVETPVANEVSNLWESERGSNAFGSSGR